ncbi:beta/gamma crystallin domain-containing protein [Streptomyces sp. VNUA24]|uniref:beta/gamma crystallin domain-containing protein n=1 Tax=Streptomyces sp. VNUA24 TaxID=3031131 RepID=UPI0023B868B8|nr:beta/gamma crystallin domain-containing protein [Streptomyces sp. VNUA24]WEH14504.1 beta/gamma crystallin domain-containing protein [Streptomyces sp. VNUA24]
MNRRAKRLVLSALTAVTAAASLTVVTAPQASAINLVQCGRPDFTHLHGTMTLSPGGQWDQCFANAGEMDIRPWVGKIWVDRIETGNNRVQWHGDDRWQPNAPIEKWVTFTWPNNPGGVHIDKIKIH